MRTLAEFRAWLLGLVARELGCAEGDLQVQRPLREYGFTSLQAGRLTELIERETGRAQKVTLVWEHPTIEALALHLAGDETVHEAPPVPSAAERVAIIGLALRYPGACTSDELWQLLRDGRCMVAPAPADRFASGRNMLGGFLSDVAAFDALHFGITPREATRMDPQQRILLELAWHALEDAAIAPSSLLGHHVGVFVGISNGDYTRLYDASHLDEWTATGNAFSIAANRLSYTFGWHGTSMALDTACSSSLVAIHLAASAVARGECELALAGGVNLILTPELTQSFEKTGLLSPDGLVRAFDAAANGYSRSEGAGLVVLKRYKDALADANPIRALVCGSAVNHGGRANGLTAPNPRAQADVLRMALASGGVSAASVDYVEAHGTGTPIGDPIEASGLGEVYGRALGRERPLCIGSIKTNLGHTESAAGVAGVAKVLAMFQHEAIPPHLHFHTGNPAASLAGAGLRVATTLETWSGNERRAAVSSFGLGGSNAHVVLEAPPPLQRDETDLPHIVPLSAHSEEALQESARQLASALDGQPLRNLALRNVALADVALTMQVGRDALPVRRAVVVKSNDELRAALEKPAHRLASPGGPVFLFAGLGEGERLPPELLRIAPLQKTVERSLRIVRSLFDLDLYADVDGAQSTLHTHLTLFIAQYALAEQLRRWGIEPVAVAGHSLGEYVAATVAGVWRLEEALRLVALRAQLLERAPPGGMLAVLQNEAELVLPAGVEISAVNAPTYVTVSGAEAALSALAKALGARGIACMPIAATRAFHSSALAALEHDYLALFEGQPARPLRVPMVSTTTGEWLTDAQVADPARWWQHTRSRVRFSDAMRTVLLAHERPFVEVGTGVSLALFVRQAQQQHLPRDKRQPVLAALGATPEGDALSRFLRTVGELWQLGATVKWPALHRDLETGARAVSLPGYPFERQHYWLPARVPVASHHLHAPSWRDRPRAAPLSGAVHVMRPGEPLADARAVVFLFEDDALPALIAVYAALARAQKPVRLLVVARGACAVESTDVVQPQRAMLGALVKAMAQEHPQVSAALLDPGAAPDMAALCTEALSESVDRIVALRGGRRWCEAYEPWTATPAPLALPGVYVVLGGGGRIGQLCTAYLRARGAREVIALSRRHGVDLTERGSVSRALDTVREAHGSIDGIVHAAGGIDVQWLGRADDLTPARFAPHAALRIDALAELAQAVANTPPRFVLALSSLSAVLAGLQLAAYATTHAYMDAFFALADSPRCAFRALDWDGKLPPELLAQALDALLAPGGPQRLVASSADLDSAFRQWVQHPESAAAPAPDARVPRPARLRSTYLAPRTDIEKFLVETLEALLGISGIGVDDSFLALGGNSLSALQMQNRIRERYGFELDMKRLFDTLTVAALAQDVEDALERRIDGMSDAEVMAMLGSSQ